MHLRLLITKGPRKGEEFSIKDDIVIGRSKGDLQLRDHKASNPHAQIRLIDENEIQIEDLKSSNGTFLNNHRIKTAKLKHNDVLRIGKTTFRVSRTAPQEKRIDFEKDSWQKVIDDKLQSCLSKSEKVPLGAPSLKVFKAVVHLEFIAGIQRGTSYLFGFGPRQVGALCIDGFLKDSNAPPIAFELSTLTDGSCGIWIKDKSVFINGQYLENKRLEDGDMITFGDSQIVTKLLPST